jgi:hypothetical protein
MMMHALLPATQDGQTPIDVAKLMAMAEDSHPQPTVEKKAAA